MDETSALLEVSILDGGLDHLSWISLRVVHLLHHSHTNILSVSLHGWSGQEFSVDNWVEFEILVVILEADYEVIFNLEVNDEEEGADLLDHILRLTLGEDKKLVLPDGCALDVTICNISVLVVNPRPFIVRVSGLISSAIYLEAIILEVN